MIKNKKILAIIPARKNSKRIKNKNLIHINDKPLISHTIEEALKCKYIDKIVVSTDDKKIASISKKHGVIVEKLRPAKLSNDVTKTIDVVIYEINELKNKGEVYDYLILLQPTSPFRTKKNINEAINLLIKKDAKSIIGVCETGHPMEWINTLNKNHSMNNFVKKKFHGLRSQDLKKNYQINGAIYLLSIKDLIKQNTFLLKDKSYAYIMNEWESIDIDRKIDLEFVNFLIKENYVR